MATSSPSPSSSLADPPTSTDTTPPPSPPETSTPAPEPPTQINADPPESSSVPSPPPPDTSPPPASPTPVSTPPPVVATSPPPEIATSPPPSPPTTIPTPPTTDAPPPSSPPPPTTPTQLPSSPPPPYISPPSPDTESPPVQSPPSDPPSSPPPPPPATKPKSPPPPSTSPPTHSSPPPPHSKSDPPVSQPPPPPHSRATTPPPTPSTTPSHRPSSPQSPKSSPPPPVQKTPTASPPKDSPPSPSTQISPSLLSPPPPGSSVPSPPADGPLSDITSGSPSKGRMSSGEIVATSVAVLIILGLIGLVVLYMKKRKGRSSKHNGGYVVPSPFGSSPRSDFNLIVKTEGSSPFVRSASGSGTLSPHSYGGLGQSRSWFTYQELHEATNGFAADNLLGEGGFGCVYKGVLANDKLVAVKQLKIGASQGEREFKAEVEIISRIHHRHLVSLVGYCIYESKRLLVYEYVPNQTLYYHLHGQNRPVMDWATRMKIAEGSARGIAYLHEDCHPRIIHRDIKSSNILLDNKFEAQVADFGLAKLALDVDTHVSTRVMGTFGYMAPEYATSGKLTEKSDVYSFGVVLLELLTGRKPVDASQPVGDDSLVEWARPLLGHALDTGQVEGLVDPRLEKNYVESELFLMVEAAAACVRHSATKRPRMGQVVRAFDSLSPSDLSNGMRVGHSEIYDSAQQSAEIRWFRRMAFGSQEYSTDYFSEATRNPGYINPNQNNQGPVFTAQHSRNDPSQQQSQNIYFSSQRTQGPTLSGQWSQDPTVFRQSSRDMDSANRQSQSS